MLISSIPKKFFLYISLLKRRTNANYRAFAAWRNCVFYNLFKLCVRKRSSSSHFRNVYFLYQKIRKTMHDFSVFFPWHVNILCRFVNATMTKHNPRFDTLFFFKNALCLFSFLFFFFLFVIVSPVGGKDFTDAAASFLYCRDISYNNEKHLHMSLVVRV